MISMKTHFSYGLNKIVSILLAGLLLLSPLQVFSQNGLTINHLNKKDYNLEGKIAAQKDYKGTGVKIGGFFTCTIFPFIGWGVGSLILSKKSVKVPEHYLSDLSASEKIHFKSGYTKFVKKKRMEKFHKGAGLGSFVAIAFYMLVYTQIRIDPGV